MTEERVKAVQPAGASQKLTDGFYEVGSPGSWHIWLSPIFSSALLIFIGCFLKLMK
jgi:hypothetical protein